MGWVAIEFIADYSDSLNHFLEKNGDVLSLFECKEAQEYIVDNESHEAILLWNLKEQLSNLKEQGHKGILKYIFSDKGVLKSFLDIPSGGRECCLESLVQFCEKTKVEVFGAMSVEEFEILVEDKGWDDFPWLIKLLSKEKLASLVSEASKRFFENMVGMGKQEDFETILGGCK